MRKRYKFPYQVMSEILRIVTRAGVCFPSVECRADCDKNWIIGGIHFTPIIKRLGAKEIESCVKQNARILIKALKLEIRKRTKIPAYRKIKEKQDIRPSINN